MFAASVWCCDSCSNKNNYRDLIADAESCTQFVCTGLWKKNGRHGSCRNIVIVNTIRCNFCIQEDCYIVSGLMKYIADGNKLFTLECWKMHDYGIVKKSCISFGLSRFFRLLRVTEVASNRTGLFSQRRNVLFERKGNQFRLR